MQVDEMIMEEEEEENHNKNRQTARVSRHSDLGREPVSRQGNTYNMPLLSLPYPTALGSFTIPLRTQPLK